ncbi:DUF1546-domain-containing protein [Nadsonia fulvescens var. elongata DSM 6958]|uniref:TBP-associated factor 6 n=1 Tax=Nadsonia fulvescens var. elongata DSM 6958 TaxID=857566 RepID=A0A1E3PTC0_9ASCO|nr:DUF1546-domain-containing protein [Nadsonia fulvescens var. elongata DSM 6958]
MAAHGIKLSHTLWSPYDTVRDVAENIGINNLPDEVSKTLAMDIEYRIHEVIEQALKFMRHSKRTTLTTNDISESLRVLNVEPLYGYETARPLTFNEALVGPGQTLYYADDEEVDFEKIINQPLPKVPRAPTFTAHWLAIEGVQPAIPQNPLSSEIRSMPLSLRGSQTSNARTALASMSEVKPLVKHVLSKELQLYFDRVVGALTQASTSPATVNGGYISTSMSNDDHMKNAALSSLKNDPGLHQLVPYFVQFVAEKITHNLKNIHLLITMLEVIDAMLSNPTIFIEPYIHALMPSVLTLLLAKKIGTKSDIGSLTHFKVREFSASLLKSICDNYGETYHTLKPRVTRTLLKGFMDVTKPIGTLYGSIVGLKALGPEVVRIVVIGNIKIWENGVSQKQNLKPEDRAVLNRAVIDSLRLMKSEVIALKYAEGNSTELSEADTNKLTSIVGSRVIDLVLRESDGVDIARGIIDSDIKL